MDSTAWTARRALSAALLIALASLPEAAGAFVAPEPTGLAIDRLGKPTALDARTTAAIEASLQGSPAWLAWSRQHPGWRVSWNVRTRTPHRMAGPGLRVPGPLAAATIESTCRDLLASTAGLTGVQVDALRLARAEHRLGRWYVVFEQLDRGRPVRGARVDVRLADGGEVVLLGSDFHRDVQVPAAPSLSASQALAAATRDLPAAARDPRHVLVVVPEPRGDGYAYRLAYELRFRTRAPRGEWLALVDAVTGELLRREDEIRYAQLTGTITAQIEPNTVGETYVTVPLPDTRLNVGNGATEFGYTDAAGQFDVSTASTDSVDVRTRLSGLYARVFNYAQGFTTPQIDARMLPGSPRDFAWNDSNSRASERDAYHFALVSHQYIRDLDPAFTGVDYTMPVTVDINDRDCNAFWDGFGINFFGESSRCANTARIADVVMHEYGHGVTDRQYAPFAPSGAMHEGFSDYFAATITDQPIIGRGFRGPGTSLRTVDNTLRSPEDLNGEVHHDGLIIAGALWDLRQQLGGGLTDSLFHYARYGLAENYDDYMLDVLVTDDDDADIYNGTPHFHAIVDAFMAHGIGDYSVQITHEPEPDTEDVAKTLRLDTTILSVFGLDPASLLVRWSANGGPWNALPLAPAATGSRDFTATLPAQTSGTTVEYTIEAADTLGHSATLPPEGMAAPFSFRVGTDTTPPTIVHTPLDDRPLDAPGWSVEATVDDNLDHDLRDVVVAWSRNATTLDQLLPLAPLGASRWRAALPTAGASLGDSIFYRISAADSAMTPNIAQSPESGQFGFRIVQGFARDFEIDNGGFVGDGDWEWGAPLVGPPAYSGTNVWITRLAGSYSNNQESFLDLGSIDLSTWSRAALVFRAWFESEPVYDGGNVQVSTDGGANWTPIVPNGGYPYDNVLSLQEPGWSGPFPGWQKVELDLSQFLGQTIGLRLRFASDAGLVDLGWAVDDLEIVERQVLSVPLALVARSGQDAQVTLSWGAPAGIDPSPPGTSFEGYHVYRATSPDLTDAVRVTTAALLDPSYVDGGLVNGTVYWYAVTAVYAEGESEPSPAVAGQPYVAGYASDAVALYVPVPLGGAADTSVTFSNTGTGFLDLNVFLGDATDTGLDDVRIAYEIQSLVTAAERVQGLSARATRPAAADHAPDADAEPEHPVRTALLEPREGKHPPVRTLAGTDAAPTASWQLLYTDAQEAVTPDLHELWVSEAAAQLTFRLNGWQSWGNPLTDFNVIFGIDADADRSTGDATGQDLYVLVGSFAISQLGVPAVIVTNEQDIVGVPGYVHVPVGADSLEVGFPSAIVGETGQRVYFGVTALANDMQTFLDGMPDLRMTSLWMQPEALHVRVPAGSPTALTLHFPGSLAPGRYTGKLFLETNAPATPTAVIPVTYDFAVTEVTIQDLSAVQEDGDVVVRWRTGREVDVRAFRVYRAREGGPLEPLARDLEPEPDHAYVYRDGEAMPGRTTYRIGEVGPGGNVTLHGGVTITVAGRVPRVAFLDPAVPNPFNPTTTLRYGIVTPGPADLVVYDARGRIVRVLWRAPSAAPGTYAQLWDGRDDHGVRVASGVYHVRLRTAGNAYTHRVTLLK